MSAAYVWIDPARRSGEPCIGGHRLPVEMVVEAVWSSSFATRHHSRRWMAKQDDLR